MLINKKKVKLLIKEHGKQTSNEYLDQLDYKLRELVMRSIRNSKSFKRLKASELL